MGSMFICWGQSPPPPPDIDGGHLDERNPHYRVDMLALNITPLTWNGPHPKNGNRDP